MEVNDSIKTEVYALADSGAVDDAVRLSGEELARADNRWRVAHNKVNPESVIRLKEAVSLAVVHADMLMRAQLYRDAYATVVTTLMSLSMEKDIRPVELADDMLALTAIATMALDAFSDTIPHDEVTERHFPVITIYCASMLYGWYAHAVRNGGEKSVWLARVTSLLRTLIRAGVVQWPEIEVEGRCVTVTDIAALSADLAGRSLAIGLL